MKKVGLLQATSVSVVALQSAQRLVAPTSCGCVGAAQQASHCTCRTKSRTPIRTPRPRLRGITRTGSRRSGVLALWLALECTAEVAREGAAADRSEARAHMTSRINESSP